MIHLAGTLQDNTRTPASLLKRVRELSARMERGVAADPAALSALIAELRPMRAQPGDGALAADLLAREVDALSADAAQGAGDSAWQPRLQRRLGRVEVLLELCGNAAVPPVPATGRPRPMADEELRAFLKGCSWGVLGTSGPDGPYAVPVSFGGEGDAVYVASREGRKLSHLRADGAACLAVVRVEGPERWRSVVVRGRAVELGGLARMRGMAAIARQRGRLLGTSGANLLRASRAVVFRIDPGELTGRVAGA